MTEPETIVAEYLEREPADLAVRDVAPIANAPFPTVTPEEAREAMRKYLAICEAVLTPADYQSFRERGKDKNFKKKSAVKKLQTFFGLSVTLREMVRDDLGDGHFGFRCFGIATAPNGRVVEASGGCSTFEERFEIKRYDDESEYAYAARLKKANARSYHDVMSTAETRATNRAVMNCIGAGGGEVTADEISRPAAYAKPAPPPEAPRAPVTQSFFEHPKDRAKRLGIDNLVEWAAQRKCEWKQSALHAALDQYEAERAAPAATTKAAKKPTDAQKKMYFALCGELEMNDEKRHAFNAIVTDKQSFSEFTFDDAHAAIDELNRRLDTKNAGA